MTIREVTAYQVACDHCGRTADDLGTRYSSWDDPDYANEAWADAGGIAIGGRHVPARRRRRSPSARPTRLPPPRPPVGHRPPRRPDPQTRHLLALQRRTRGEAMTPDQLVAQVKARAILAEAKP